MPRKPKSPEKTWYGVRTLYRVTAKGKPKLRDKHFDPESTLIEDRVVLFQATSSGDAVAQATREARTYSRQIKFVNPYGQKVQMRLLDACDAYEISEMPARKPGAGSEVYSLTELVRASVSDSAVVKKRMGGQASLGTVARWKFVNARIAREALALMASDSPAERQGPVGRRPVRAPKTAPSRSRP
jgi:hypothetical protein